MFPLLLSLAFAQEPTEPPAEPATEVTASGEEAPVEGASDESTPDTASEDGAPDEASAAPESEAPAEGEWKEIEARPSEGEAAPAVQASGNEIIVWGEGAIRHATEEIVGAMEDLDYKVVARKKDGTIVFKPPATWKGRVALKEGMLDFRRPVVALWLNEPERETQYDPDSVFDGTDAPQASGLRFVFLPSKRRLAAVEEKVLEGTHDEVLHYREVVQRTASEDLLYVLPSKLDALWRDGQALDGGEPLTSPEARKAHVLEYWATRADTELGAKVRTAVEAWLSATVQESETPLTVDEIARAEATAGRKLSL
ncbi:MAG: hypothetical protein EP330_24595 [Deltaproteobacteria bacterium]|nr:MAG: hypothetical protein EP330_24595 [Deltaproteobacteria bacterium]